MLTREDHIARAMLMGMQYQHYFGYYYTHPLGLRIDAITLETLHWTEAKKRQEKAGRWGERPAWYLEGVTSDGNTETEDNSGIRGDG